MIVFVTNYLFLFLFLHTHDEIIIPNNLILGSYANISLQSAI